MFFLSLLIAIVLWLFFTKSPRGYDIGAGVAWMFSGLIIVPLFFGIFSLLFSKERRFVKMLLSSVIAFGVVIFMFILVFTVNKVKERREIKKAYSNCMSLAKSASETDYCKIYKY